VEIGVGLIFGAFLVDKALFLVSCISVGSCREACPAYSRKAPLFAQCSDGCFSVSAVLALAFPTVLLGDVGTLFFPGRTVFASERALDGRARRCDVQTWEVEMHAK